MTKALTVKGRVHINKGHLKSINSAVNDLTPSANPPTITSFSPNSGFIGDSVIIQGTNFSGLVSVKFNGVIAETNSVTDTQLTAIVPNGATTGKIKIVNAVGSVTSTTNFTVNAIVSGVAPDYSSLVTRESIGLAGQGNENYIDKVPTAKICRLEVACNTVMNWCQLSAGISSSDVSIGVKGVTGLPGAPFNILVDSEYMNVTGVSGSGSTRTLTVTRGIRASTAVSHSLNAGVSSWNWSGLDGRVKKVLDLNDEILALITYNSNDYTGWNNDKAVLTKNGTANSDANGHTFAQWITWWSVAFAKEVMQRYSRYGNAKPTTGVLASKITSTYCINFVETWNEADNSGFWQPNNHSSYTTYGGHNAAYDYAELCAAVYDAIKSISAGIFVGTCGTAAGRPEVPNASGIKSYVFYEDLIARWDAMNYTQCPNGWSDVPADFICHHPYCGTDRPGNSQQSRALPVVINDVAYNACYVDVPRIHNLFYNKGWGSLKIWGTESENNFDKDCEDGYGFRNHSTTYVQNNAFPNIDRACLSYAEGYDRTYNNFRYWTGKDPSNSNAAYAWPASGSNRPQWAFLGREARATDDLPLGPKFYFSGGEDFGAWPYDVPYRYIDHFGLWDPAGNKKSQAGANNDPHDALARFAKTP